MIWRVIVVIICIVIVLSAVWAASNSFEVSVDGPGSFGESVIIATPTPMTVTVDQPFRRRAHELQHDTVYFDVSVPDTHVVFMPDGDDNLGDFHLCRGGSHCTGGLLSVEEVYLDGDRDGLANIIRLYFRGDDVKALLSSTAAEVDDFQPTNEPAGMTSSAPETVSESGSSSPGNDESTDRHMPAYRFMVSGEIDAWKLFSP